MDRDAPGEGRAGTSRARPALDPARDMPAFPPPAPIVWTMKHSFVTMPLGIALGSVPSRLQMLIAGARLSSGGARGATGALRLELIWHHGGK
jgi:hypothetical protein